MHISSALIAPILLAASASARFVMYADEWHPTRPTDPSVREGITHVVIAFAMANETSSFQSKTPIATWRSEYPNAKIMCAVGGWGDPSFAQEVASTSAMTTFVTGVKNMLDTNGLDGVDIDWEYPGGNGADYKQIPNSAKTGEIPAYPNLLKLLRQTLGNDKIISIATPGLQRDMIAYTKDNSANIWAPVDYINVMAYDLMNRRDNVTKHHTSVEEVRGTIENYLALGAPASKINLGFAYYAKYFQTQGDCGSQPLGCPIVPAENSTGGDTHTSGVATFESTNMIPIDTSNITVSSSGTCGAATMTKCSTGCCSVAGYCGTSADYCTGGCQHAFGTGCQDKDVASSWQKALKGGVADEKEGGQYYFDAANELFWTWDTPEFMKKKFDTIVKTYQLGGVMAWSLGEDSYDWSHVKLMAQEISLVGSGSSNSTYQPSAAVSSSVAPTTMAYSARSAVPETATATISDTAATATDAATAAATSDADGYIYTDTDSSDSSEDSTDDGTDVDADGDDDTTDDAGDY